MKTKIVFLFALIMALGLTAQDNAEFNQIRFALNNVFFDKLETSNISGHNYYKTGYAFGTPVAIYYHQPIAKGWGINVGTGIMTKKNKAGYSPEFPENSIFYGSPEGQEEIVNTNWCAVWYFPVTIEKMFPLKRNAISTELGVCFNNNFTRETMEEDCLIYLGSDTSSPSELLFRHRIDYNRQITLSYMAKAGYIFFLKNNNTIQLNILANYSPQVFGEGKYWFYNLPEKNYGTIKENINYFGWEILFGLTLNKNKK